MRPDACRASAKPNAVRYAPAASVANAPAFAAGVRSAFPAEARRCAPRPTTRTRYGIQIARRPGERSTTKVWLRRQRRSTSTSACTRLGRYFEERVFERARGERSAKLAERPVRDAAPGIEDDGAVAQRLGRLDQMRAQHDRVALGGERANQPAQLALRARVEPDHRLVEQKHGRAA